MNVIIFGYRDWATDLAEDVKAALCEIPTLRIESRTTFSEWALSNQHLAFFVGWSDIIPEEVYTRTTCIVLHPSPLPLYRGGSPIQHQIINGEKVSAVTLFKLDKDYPGIDAGPIAWQMPFSLEGTLDEVLRRITEVGSLGVQTLIRQALSGEGLSFIPQLTEKDGDPGMLRPRKRRKPEESEIKSEDFGSYSAEKLHNKIRALQDPYPLPYVTCADGRRLYILRTLVELEQDWERRRLLDFEYMLESQSPVPGEEVERGPDSDGPTPSDAAPSSHPDDYDFPCRLCGKPMSDHDSAGHTQRVRRKAK